MKYEHLSRLQQALFHIDSFIENAVRVAQAADYNPTSSLRGLVMTQEEIEHYRRRSPLESFWSDNHPRPDLFQADTQDPLYQLIINFDLSILDVNILLLCLAPHFDQRYHRLYAYLQDNVSQKHASVLLLTNLLGADAVERFEVLSRLYPQAPLLQHKLLTVVPLDNNQASSLLSDVVSVDARLVHWLLGDTHVDARLRHHVTHAQARDIPIHSESQISTIPKDEIFLYLQSRDDTLSQAFAARLCDERAVLCISAKTIISSEDQHGLWTLFLREGRLAGAALLIEAWDIFSHSETVLPDGFWQALLAYPYPIFLCGEKIWEPSASVHTRLTLRIDLMHTSYEQRVSSWCQILEKQEVHTSLQDIEALASRFKVSHSQIERAVKIAHDSAFLRDMPPNTQDLYLGVQEVSVPNLEHLARPLKSSYTWTDLVLPSDQIEQLNELRNRLQYAQVIQNDWGFGRREKNVTGVKVLFAGESGTGKTMAAQVLANDLGMLLYRIDLSMVVSKYIGETEKNLRAIFDAAQDASAILFFDEADALFGKRSDVKDAHDRYANIETSYLLQQFETFDGIAILATNLRQNLDKAFTRRLDFLIDFPFPDTDYRETIWQKQFPSEAPLDKHIDFSALASRYHLAGGNIRNAAIAAAYLAAANGNVINQHHIQHAIRREQQKMGRLID